MENGGQKVFVFLIIRAEALLKHLETIIMYILLLLLLLLGA